MIAILLKNPLLLLFLVSAIGYTLGRITIAGSSLGVAAVLFVGLAFGALHPDLKLPDLIYQFGLVVFVYTIGLSSGQHFFRSLGRKGLRDNLLVLGLLTAATGLTLALGWLLRLTPAQTAGVFTGSLTNTAALAGVLDYLKTSVPEALRDQLLAEPVVGFSITYPMGVIGMILVISVLRWLWRVDLKQEATELHSSATGQRLLNRTVVVTQPAAAGTTIQALLSDQRWDVTFGRVRQSGQLALTTGQTRLNLGDLITVIGPHEAIQAVTSHLGEPSDQHLEADRSEFDFRRIFVSNPAIAGRCVRDLKLHQQFGAFITRVRRGDGEFVAHGDTILELGDRVRVIARPEQMEAVSRFFGDSYRALSEIDMLTFPLGLALGLLIGMIPLPLPGGMVITLGFAGGPLVVALILGALERTGPLVWNLPYSANLTLRQLGLILFLAGVGTRSGYAFISTLQQGGGAIIFAAGLAITVSVALAMLLIGYRLLKIPLSLLLGMLAGLQTQPALLGFALEQTDNDLPNVGYAAVYPAALIFKIVCAQLILALMG
ncbi:MAG TPA: aspartate:alanine exchanger family transporter [Herpetosiphonaceae bacterium]